VVARDCIRLGDGILKVAKDDAYGQLPEANSKHVYRLSEDYMATATQDVALQAKAVCGSRLY
jgi:hypothetical protein